MEKYYELLLRCPLFEDFSQGDIQELLKCLNVKKLELSRNQSVFTAKSVPIGIVLSGGVNIEQVDFWGNRTILTHISGGGMFGEAIGLAHAPELPINAVASENSTVLLLSAERILGICPFAHDFHTKLIRNLVGILSRKNVLLTKKIEHLSQRSTKNKLLSYLSDRATLSGSPSFDIPFDRQELADYLCVDRSALSYEISKLKAAGILTCRKNRFTLLPQ